MKILEVHEGDQELINFKNREYPISDKQLYGETHPSFTPKSFTIIAKNEGNILGFVSCIIKSGITYIDFILIGVKYRNRGIGKKLIIAAELKAKELGSHKIWLETRVSWNLKGFYEKLGYIVRASLPNDVDHQEYLLMDKML